MTLPTPTIVAGIDVGKSALDAHLEPGCCRSVSVDVRISNYFGGTEGGIPTFLRSRRKET